MATPQAGMKKRQVIANSNRAMFIWIAIASAIVGVCAVVGYFMVQQIMFRGRVAAKAESTATTLRKNNVAAKSLIENVRVRGTDGALNSIKARPDDRALQVVLDALPADINTLALGSSLQEKIIGEAVGVKIESLVLEGVSADAATSSVDGLGTIPFILTASSSDANALKDMLLRMERSIRTLDIDTLALEKTDTNYTLSLTAHAYYQPGKTVQLNDEVEKP